jgi:hypothetical protein
MRKFPDQKKIINILFIAAVVILIINLLFGKIFTEENNPEPVNELTLVEVDSTFRLALANLGIQDEWIRDEDKNEDPVYLSVQIPKDLHIVLILQEMNNVFDTSRVLFNSVEKKIGGITTLNIISGDETKLIAEINYSNKLKRNTVRVGFIIKGFGEESERDSLLIEYPEQFAILLVPSKSAEEDSKKILMKGKEYIIYLNDAINELKFKLSDNYSITRLKNSIIEIVSAFPRAIFFMMDDKSTLFNYKVYTLLREELEKRKIKLIDEINFSYLSPSEENNLTEVFNDSLKTLERGEDKLFILSAGDFLSLNPEIMKYRKIGYKFINPSAIKF